MMICNNNSSNPNNGLNKSIIKYETSGGIVSQQQQLQGHSNINQQVKTKSINNNSNVHSNGNGIHCSSRYKCDKIGCNCERYVNTSNNESNIKSRICENCKHSWILHCKYYRAMKNKYLVTVKTH